jgi:transcription initiation factor TFIIH subunit 4
VPSDTPDKYTVDVDFLDRFAREQWDGILHYMVGSTPSTTDGREVTGPSEGVRRLMERGGLIRHGHITKDGFSFLLQDVNTQVWTLLIFYLENEKAVS